MIAKTFTPENGVKVFAIIMAGRGTARERARGGPVLARDRAAACQAPVIDTATATARITTAPTRHASSRRNTPRPAPATQAAGLHAAV